MSDSEGKLFIYSIIGFFGGLYLFYSGFMWLRLKRLIENIPTSKVRSLAMGLAEVYGEVLSYEGKLLKSPMLNRDCVYYSYSIKEERGSGKNRHWITLKSGTDMVHFCLKDDTGKVLVDPQGAKVDFKKDLDVLSSFGRDPPQVVKNAIKRMNLSYETFLGINKTMKYEETVIGPNDKLYILGTAGDNPFVEDATTQKNEEDIMMKKGKNEKTYFISDSGERDLLKGLKWKSFGGIIGGAALSVVCLAIILFMLHLF